MLNSANHHRKDMNPPVKKDNIEAIFRLSPTQEGILFHSLYFPKSAIYFNQFCCTLNGEVDGAELKEAWTKAVERHQVLRTLFTWERRNKPLQIVRQRVEVPWEYHDWQGHPVSEQGEKLELYLEEDRNRGFDLSKAPLIRFVLFRLDTTKFKFLWSFHHIILDGWSMRLVLKEVLSSYNLNDRVEGSKNEPMPSFQDYIHWLQKLDLAKAETFWRDYLKGFTQSTQIRQSARGFNSDNAAPLHRQKECELSASKTATLKSIARENRVTMNTVLQGVWAILLHHYSGDSDIVFGTTFSGRPASLDGVENMVGLFINTLPVRIKLESNLPLTAWLKEIQHRQLELSPYENSPLVHVQSWSEVPRGQNLFESILVFENLQPNAAEDEENTRLEIGDSQYFERSNYPLALLVVPDATLKFIVIYDSTRFTDVVISRLLRHLETVIEAIISNPNQQHFDLQILPEEERRQILIDWSGTRSSSSHRINKCWHQTFEAKVPDFAQNTALVYTHQSLNYGELNTCANQIAHHLIQLGITPGTLVGICLGRSIEIITGLLGILKAGGAYVPLDPTYPKERLKFILEDTKVSILLTKQEFLRDLPENECQFVLLDTHSDRINGLPEHNLNVDVKPDNLAYIMYTSGSSGTPKGVMVTHKNLEHSTNSRIKYYTAPLRGFLLFPTYAFDSAVAGIFWTLSTGGVLHIPEDDRFMETSYLGQLIQQHNISHMLCIPSFYEQLLNHESGCLSSLTTMIVAGEACPVDLVKKHFKLLRSTSLFNEYGPTEATVWSTVYECNNDIKTTTVPIGNPLPDTQIYILSPTLKPVPIGVPGELFIGGNGLTEGYLNRSELTHDKFILNPFARENNGQGRLYRTGDIVKFFPDGNLEFLGRNDNQVKIRGFRIELDEIANVVRQHPSVKEAIVTAEDRSETPSSINGDAVNTMSNLPDLEEMVPLIDPNTMETMLSEIEGLSDAEAEDALSTEAEAEVPGETDRQDSISVEDSAGEIVYSKNKSNRDFEINFNLKNKDFICPPRTTQKEWLLTQLQGHDRVRDRRHGEHFLLSRMGKRLRQATGHPPPDPGLRPGGLSRGADGLDCGEVSDLDGLRRRPGKHSQQGRVAGQCDDVLAYQLRRIIRSPLLGELCQSGPGPGGHADGRVHFPEGDFSRQPPLGGEAVQQHHSMECAGQGWPLCRL